MKARRSSSVLEALRIAKERDPDLAIDGEFQLDSAVVPAVAARKVPGGSAVAGRANILIFPDLDAGNITYKAVQTIRQGRRVRRVSPGLRQEQSAICRAVHLSTTSSGWPRWRASTPRGSRDFKARAQVDLESPRPQLRKFIDQVPAA